MKRGSMLLPLLLLVLLTACGSGKEERNRVEKLVTEAIQEYENRESVEVYVTVTNVLESGTHMQNDSMLWRHGNNWLMETRVPAGDETRLITQLQYGNLLFTEYLGEVSCQELTLEGVGQVTYEGFDSYTWLEDGSCVITLERKATGAAKQKNIVRRSYTMTLDAEGALIHLLTQDHNEKKEHLDQETRILSWDTPICEEKIEEAYIRLREKAE